MRKWIVAALALFAALTATGAQAKWLRADTDNFIIYSEGSETSLRDFAADLQRFDATLRSRFGVAGGRDANRVTVYLVPYATDAGRLASGKSGSSIGGFYRSDIAGSFAVAIRDNSDIKGTPLSRQVLFHEYAHHFMKRYLRAAFPAWFIEGFAEFYSTTEFNDQARAEIGRPVYSRAYGLLNAPKIPAETIITQRPRDARSSGQQINVYYGRAWLLTHLLYYDQPRAGQIGTYINAINRGEDNKAAAIRAFGDLGELDKELNRYMTRTLPYHTTADPVAVTGSITVSPLSPAEDALMPLRLERRNARDDVKLAEVRDGLKKLSLVQPDDAGLWFELASAEFDMDRERRDLVAARAAIDKALSIDPDHVRANVLLGRIMGWVLEDKAGAMAADWDAARVPIARAVRTDPNDAAAHYSYFSSFAEQGIAPPTAAIEGLGRAFFLAPEVPRVRIAYAFALANLGDFGSAVQLAKVIAFDPHDDGEGDKLLARLEAMRDKRLGGAPAAATANSAGQ